MKHHQDLSKKFKQVLPYLVRYALILFAYLIAVEALKIMLNSISMTGMSFVAPYVASMSTAEWFLKKEKRIPSPTERNILIFGGLYCYLGFNLFILMLLWISGNFDIISELTKNTTVMMMVGLFVIVVFIVNYFMMRSNYHGWMKKRADKLGIILSDEP